MDLVEVMKSNPPRLVVLYNNAPDSGERYKWGVVGTIPILTLIGYITRVQVDLASMLAEERNNCPEPALVIVWDGKDMDWCVHPSVPTDSLIGMLEVIKTSLVNNKAAQQQPSSGLLGPDGTPVRW